ncbi:MAG: hypothetical protein AB9919_03085 [Geobacteraceae bacterium]
MAKRAKTMAYGIVGSCGGVATLVSAAGPCSPGDCSVCFRCFGMGIILVALALFHRKRRGEIHGLAHDGK